MQSHSSLRLALRLNAAFSTISAISIAVAHTELSEMMGIPADILIGVAVGLAGFAGYLVFTAGRTDAAKLLKESLQHSIADFAWVVGTVVVIALGLVTPTGNWILAGVAAVVLALGAAQWRGLSEAPDATATATATAIADA